MNNLQQKYLEKLRNDVQEKLYDLLIMHIQNAHEKVSKNSRYSDELVAILDKALSQLEGMVKEQNKMFIYRYMLIICNRILAYRTTRQDIKNLKMRLVADYTHSEDDLQEQIPLNNQINELRITWDASYLSYIMKKFVKKKLWDKALYTLIAVRLIEPDNEDIEPCYKEIRANMPKEKMKKAAFKDPKNTTLALDTNAIISHILFDVGDYRIKSYKAFDLAKLGNHNKFLITESVRDEVLSHIEYKMVGIRLFCKNRKRFNAEGIEKELKRRLGKLWAKYGYNKLKVKKRVIHDIKKMYLSHLDVLEGILLAKIQSSYVSHKLRKLAQRESMLPEEGDIRLLAECISIGGNIGILTKDKDFTEFAGEIYQSFGVKVYA